MKLVKIWNTKRERFFSSGKGRDSWGSVGKARTVMKTSYFPEYGYHASDYVFITYDLVEASRVEV